MSVENDSDNLGDRSGTRTGPYTGRAQGPQTSTVGSAAGGYYSAILSFLLPGAGQLFAGRSKLALVFFVLFIACLWTPSTVGIAFIVALVAGLECVSRERSPAQFSFSRRFFIYLTASFLGFCCWFFAVGGQFLFGNVAEAATTAASEKEVITSTNTDLVDIKKVDFTIHVDMVFADTKNIQNKKILPENRCIVRRPVAEALARAQATLKLKGLSLKLRDCYRPTSLETKFIEWTPKKKDHAAFKVENDPKYRGAAVDAIVVQADGQPVVLPADKYYWDAPEVDIEGRPLKRARAFTGATLRKAKVNARALKDAMQKEGFVADSSVDLKRWWYFRYNNWEQYSTSDMPFSEIP